MTRLTCAALAVFASCVTARADSAQWSGFYAGVQSGYGWPEADLTFPSSTSFIDYRPDGAFGGVMAGYNYATEDGFVLGLEADIALGGRTENDATAFSGGTIDPRYLGVSRLEASAALRARVGYAMGNVLPYIAGGVSWAYLESGILRVGSTVEDIRHRDFLGFTVGAGVEYAVGESWTLRVEYRYSDFGSEDYGQGAIFGAPTAVDLTSQDVRLGAAYRF